MLSLFLFSTLFSFIFTVPEEKIWSCNTLDTSISYTYCDDIKFPISIRAEPCVSLRGTNGFLHIFYIPRRDLKKLYINFYVSFNSMELPTRKAVICRGFDDDYSICRALKGETVNTTIPFSFKGIRFLKVIAKKSNPHFIIEEKKWILYSPNLKSYKISSQEKTKKMGQYKCIAEAIAGDIEEKLFCLNFTITHRSNFN